VGPKYPDGSSNFMQMLAQFRRPVIGPAPGAARQIDAFVESTQSGNGRISAARKIVQMAAFAQAFSQNVLHKDG